MRRVWRARFLTGLLVGLFAAHVAAQTDAGKTPPKASGDDKAAADRGPASDDKGASDKGSDKAAAKDDKPKVVGGYSWRDKPGRARKWRPAKKKRKFDPNAPTATYPGFRMLPDGRSQIYLMISKQVSVEVRRAEGRVAYVMAGVQVSNRNNENALVTTFFNTPVARTRLAHQESGAQLVLELREAVEPKHSVRSGPRGTTILEITLPKSARDYHHMAESRPPKRRTQPRGRRTRR